MRLLLLVLALAASDCGPAAADWPKVETFRSNGVKLAYFTQGKGEPVVLVHGWLSSAGVNWALPGISGHLAKDHLVVAIDVRGHGLSDKPTAADAYGPELVEDVARLMDHLKLKKAHVVGYSMGGVITAKFLAKHPDRALSGTLAGMGWLRPGSVEQKVFAANRDTRPVGLCFKSLADLALSEEEVRAIKVPVRVIFGARDPIKAGYTEPLARVRPDWRVVEVRDADHLSCVARPQFRDALAAWLAVNAPPRKEP
jgi:pimeloyl-ACP methyl ester carboxylesterase